MQWKEIPRDDGVRGQWAKLYVTMNPKGRIVMSRVTYERLGEPKSFVVLFESTNNVIGIKPATLSTRNAFPVCVTASSCKGRKGGRAINVFRLVQDHNTNLPDTIQFHDAEIDHDGIMRLDLRTARVSQRSLNHYSRKREKTADGKYPPESSST